MITSQISLSLAHWLQQLAPIFIQMVLVLGCITTAVHVGGLPLLDLSADQASLESSSTLSLQAAGSATGIGVGAFGRSIYSTWPSNTYISRDSGAGRQGPPLIQIDVPLSQSDNLSHG